MLVHCTLQRIGNCSNVNTNPNRTEMQQHTDRECASFGLCEIRVFGNQTVRRPPSDKSVIVFVGYSGLKMRWYEQIYGLCMVLVSLIVFTKSALFKNKCVPQIFVCLFILHMQLNRDLDETRIRTHRYLKMASSSTSQNPMPTKTDGDDDRATRIAAHVEEPAIVFQRIFADDDGDDAFVLPMHFMRRMDVAREALGSRELETQIEPSVIFEKIFKRLFENLNTSLEPPVKGARDEDGKKPSTTLPKPSTSDEQKKDSYLMPCDPSITVNYPCNPYGGDCNMNGRIVMSCGRERSPYSG